MTEKLLTVYITTQLIKEKKKIKRIFKLHVVFYYFQIFQNSCPCPAYPHRNHSLIYPDFLKCRLCSKFCVFFILEEIIRKVQKKGKKKGQVYPEKLIQGFKNESFCKNNSHRKKEILGGVPSFIQTGVNM